MTCAPALDQLNAEQLRALAAQLTQRVESLGKQVHHFKTVNEQLTHEITLLKRHRFAKRSEQLNPTQASLLDDLLDTDIAAIEAELEALQPAPASSEARQKPKYAPLPAQFPRTLIHHEPDNTQCTCGCALKRIDEDVSKTLDYTPGVFTVERHLRGKWVGYVCVKRCIGSCPSDSFNKTKGLIWFP